VTRKIEITPNVKFVLIEDESDGICEACGKVDELRPYGKRLENGRRMSICFDCGMIDKPTSDQAIKEVFDP
jgi:hypothetical protein